MKVYSLIQQGFELVPVEIEVTLQAGLPQMIFMGLPDQMIKESAHRIQTAIKNQGFDLPPSKKILVHLKPTHLKKHSLGLDLAIAAAILWETEQVIVPASQKPFLYGELSLMGQVSAPEDLEFYLNKDEKIVFYSGPQERAAPFDVLCLKELKDLATPFLVSANPQALSWVKPDLPDLNFPYSLASIIAAPLFEFFSR